MTHHILQNENKFILALRQKLHELKKFNGYLAELLDEEMKKNVQIIKFEKDCLFVLISNGHWATQFRFRIPTLMANLQKHPELKTLKGIICKTRPNLSKIKAEGAKRLSLRLSEKSAESFLQAAKNINDPRLKRILIKIAQNT